MPAILAYEAGAARAFHFKEPYGLDGERIAIDRARVRRVAARNAQKQRDLLAHVLSAEV